MNQSTLIGSALIAILSGLWYVGVFNEVKFTDGMVGPAKFVYKKHAGPYQQSGMHFMVLCTDFKERGDEDFRMAGIYYDDPETTKNPRYLAGFLVENKGQEDRFEAFEKDFLKGFEVMNIKATKTIMSTFLVRAGNLSYGLSAMKTYPAFDKKGYTMKSGSMEIYDRVKIYTHFPQENYEQFLPEESSEE